MRSSATRSGRDSGPDPKFALIPLSEPRMRLNEASSHINAAVQVGDFQKVLEWCPKAVEATDQLATEAGSLIRSQKHSEGRK